MLLMEHWTQQDITLLQYHITNEALDINCILTSYNSFRSTPQVSPLHSDGLPGVNNSQ